MSLLSLAGCQTAAPEAAPVAQNFAWTCPDGVHFNVSYPDRGSALVIFNGQSYRLPAAVGASGIRFAANGVEFWEHQGQARFTDASGALHANCVR